MSSGSESSASIGFTLSILWAVLVASAFPAGALLSTFVRIPQRIQADIAAISAGVFLGAIAFSLVDDALKLDTPVNLLIWFAVGATVFSLADHVIKKKAKEESDGLSHKKLNDGNNSSNEKNEMKKAGGKAQSVILGTLLDSIPETLFVGIIIALPLHGLVPAALALFLGNITASIEGTKRLYDKGGRRRIILGGWTIVFIAVLAAGPLGYYIEGPLSKSQLSDIIGFAAGALMAFVTQELIPKAFQRANVHIGLSATAGFLIAFALFHFIQ